MKHFKNIILAFFMSLVLFSSSMATVSSEDTPRVQYTANGITTNFPITFAYASISDVHVYFISNSTGLATAWTKDAAGPTGYTVSAGSIIANTAPSNGYLVAVCETPVTQLVDVKPNRALPADTLEGVFDKLTLIGRDLKGTSSRSLVYGPTYTGSIPYAEDLADEIQQDSVDASVAAVNALTFATSLHIDNIAALRLFSGGETTSIYLDCHTSQLDGGNGPWVWDADSTATDNNGTIIQVTGVATGRWVRQLNGFVTPEMFGVDGIADDVQINAALAVASKVYLDEKTYVLANSVDIETDGKSLIGAGMDKTKLSGPAAGTSIKIGVTATTKFFNICGLTTLGNNIGIQLGHGTNNKTALNGVLSNIKATGSITGGIFADRFVQVVMDTVYAVANTGYGMYNLSGSVGTTLTARNCTFNLNNKGLYLYQGVNHIFENCDYSNNENNGFETGGTNVQGLLLNSCWWEGNNRTAGVAHIRLDAYPGSYSAKRITFKNCAISAPGAFAGAYSVYLYRSIGAVFDNCDFYEDPWTNNNIYVNKGLGLECINNKFIDCKPSVQRNAQIVAPYSSSGQHFSIEYDYGGERYSNVSSTNKNTISGEWDFSVDGGAVGNFDFVKLPYGATITKAWYRVETALTSGGATTIYIGPTTDDLYGLLGNTAYNNAAFDVGFHDFIPDGTTANFLTTTGARAIRMTINASALTGGKIKVFIEYTI